MIQHSFPTRRSSDQLARRLKLYATPELRFEYDESIERGDRLHRLIDSVRAKS